MTAPANAPRDNQPRSEAVNENSPDTRQSAAAPAQAETAKIVELREQQREATPPHPEKPEPPPAPVARDEKQASALAPSRASAPRRFGRGKSFLRATLMLGGIAIVVVGAAIMWLRGGRYVWTDNSYVRAAKLMVSTDVSGIVSSVEVKQGQQVEKGRILFRLDPQQFEIALAAAEAQLAQVRLNMEAARKDYQRILSDIAAADAVVKQAQAAFDRAAALAQRNAGSQATYDQTRFALAAEQNKLKSLRQAAQVALERLGGDISHSVDLDPQVKEAQARVAEARRQLDRTIVRAPFAGTVTSVESLQPGTFLVAATAALTNTGAVGLVSSDNIWIDANMKETDLTHARQGNPVEITVDTYPGRVWKGKVDSIYPTTASEFSILPAQNAGGNWVKVVQRVPMRIAIDRKPGDPPLRAGMSVVVTVDTGHRRSLADLWKWAGFSKPPVDLGAVEKFIAPPASAK